MASDHIAEMTNPNQITVNNQQGVLVYVSNFSKNVTAATTARPCSDNTRSLALQYCVSNVRGVEMVRWRRDVIGPVCGVQAGSPHAVLNGVHTTATVALPPNATAIVWNKCVFIALYGKFVLP